MKSIFANSQTTPTDHVAENLLKIAQHFSAGYPARKETSPGGTEEPSAVPPGLASPFTLLPSTKVLGYFQGDRFFNAL